MEPKTRHKNTISSVFSHTQNIFRGINVTQLFVHLDFIEQGSQHHYSNQYLGAYNAGSQASNNLLFQNVGASPVNSYNSFSSHGGGHGHSEGHGHSHSHSGQSLEVLVSIYGDGGMDILS